MAEPKIMAFSQAARVLPKELRAGALALAPSEQARVEELRLRCGRPLTAVFPEGERPLSGPEVTAEDLERLLELSAQASLHTVMSQLREGFLTIEGGHRVGLCGTAVLEGDRIAALRDLSSASIRVARQIIGVSAQIRGQLLDHGVLRSTLILAPPGTGKTSLLRDLIRSISQGEGVPPLRVGVVDQRGELGASWRGRPQLELGPRTDLLNGCPKAQGMMLLLRSMNPQVLAVDEVSAPEDADALAEAVGCGVTLLATAHGADREDLKRRRVYGEMMEKAPFRRLVTIRVVNGQRQYKVEELE